MERRRFKQVVPLDQRLAQHAQQLRKEARASRRATNVRS
jgi:hypothetical protein